MFADYLLYLEKASNKAKDLGINDLPWNSYWVASAKLALRDPYCHTQPQLTTMGIQTRTSPKKHSKIGYKGPKNTQYRKRHFVPPASPGLDQNLVQVICYLQNFIILGDFRVKIFQN